MSEANHEVLGPTLTLDPPRGAIATRCLDRVARCNVLLVLSKSSPSVTATDYHSYSGLRESVRNRLAMSDNNGRTVAWQDR